MYRLLAAIVILALSGCLDGDDGGAAAPTSAECLEQGLVLDADAPGGPACVEPPFEIEDFEDPNHHCVRTQQRDRVHAPDLVGNPWRLGQWWEYAISIDGVERPAAKIVYYDDQDLDPDGRAQHYMVGTTTRDDALRTALLGDNPMVGRVHRVLYSPHESGDHADMFHFPLCDGSSWSTVFYGETFTLTARNASLQVPTKGNVPGFVIAGTSAGGGKLELSYAPAAQWFTYIDLTRSDGGTVQMTLEAMGDGYSGDAFFLRGQKDTAVELSGEGPVPFFAGTLAEETVAREDGAEGPYDTLGLAIQARLVGNGMATLEIVDPQGDVAWTRSLGGQEAAEIDILDEVPYQAGDWVVRLSGVAVTPDAAVAEASVQIVSIYDRSGSV